MCVVSLVLLRLNRYPREFYLERVAHAHGDESIDYRHEAEHRTLTRLTEQKMNREIIKDNPCKDGGERAELDLTNSNATKKRRIIVADTSHSKFSPFKKDDNDETTHVDRDSASKSSVPTSSRDEKEPSPSTASATAAYNRLESTTPCRTSTLFVGGLHRRITDAHLHKLFQPYGNVVRIYQVMHKDPGPLQGLPKGYAFVEYDSVQSAADAIAKLNGRRLLNRTIAVKPAHQKSAVVDGGNGDDGNDKDNAIPDRKMVEREKSKIEDKIMRLKMAIEAKKRKNQQG